MIGARIFADLWARDVFISYSRADGAIYALGLAAQLSERNFACAIDQWGMSTPGAATPAQLQSLLRNCRALIIVGTRASGASAHVNSEIEQFVKTPGMIIPIDLDGSIREANWWPTIEGLPIAVESGGSTAREPDADVLARITNALTFRRRDQRLRLLAISTGSVIALMLAGMGGLAFESRRLASDNEKSSQYLADSIETLDNVRKDAGAAKQQLGLTSTALEQERASLLTARQETAVAARTAKAAEAKAGTALAQARAAQTLAAAAETRAEAARRLAGEQELLARRFSARNLLSAASLQMDTDPAAALRLAEAATRIEPDIDVRDVVVEAAVSSPAWNRFPAFPSAEYRGELTPSSSDEVTAFAGDALLQTIAHIDSGDEEKLLVTNVDSGMVIRSLMLKPSERVDNQRPFARDLLVLRRGEEVRVFDFAELASPTEAPHPAIDTVARAFDCAGGRWPCAALMPDGKLVLSYRSGAVTHSMELGNFPQADRISIHPSGDAIAVLSKGALTWIGKGGSWPDAQIQTMAFQSYGDYPLKSDPLPWLRWGPRPDSLLVVEPIVKARSAGSDTSWPEQVQLWAVRAATGQRQLIKKWDLHVTGLGDPIFETDAVARRIALSGSTEGGTSQLQLLTLSWKEANTSTVVDVAEPDEGALRGSTTSEKQYLFQTAALSPNGIFVVAGADTRGLSGTQFGFGVVESWNLDPLDEDSSARPESRSIPIRGKRHARQIAYAQNGRRIAILDNGGTISIFKVREAPASVFNSDLRMDEEILTHLAPKTFRVDARSSAWLSIFGDEDRRIYDLSSGAEIDVGSKFECGRALAAERIGDAFIIASVTCAAKLDGGKISLRQDLPRPARAARINHDLISINTGEEARFLRSADFSPLGAAQFSDNPALKAPLSYSGSESSNPNNAVFSPMLEPGEDHISVLSLGDGNLLEKWSAPISPTNTAIRFEKRWTQQLPASGWTSARDIPKANLTLILLGSNSPASTPTLYQIRRSDGAIASQFIMPQIEEKIFEVAAAGALDANNIYVVFRLATGGLISGIWPLGGGVPSQWNPIQVQARYLSGSDILGVQSHEDDRLLLVRPETNKQIVRAYSLHTGEAVWEGKFDDSLPAPMLRRTTTGWEVANSIFHDKFAARIRSGGGSIYDLVTKIMLSPEQIEQLTGIESR